MTKKTKSPLRFSPLRVPGQSIGDQMIDNAYDAMVGPYMIALLLGVIAAMEWMRWYFKTPPSPWLYTAIAVAAALWATWKIRRGLRKANLLRQGRDGERAVAQYLEWFRNKDFFVFHDVPNGDANIDHVLIGTRGIYVIETKTLSHSPSWRMQHQPAVEERRGLANATPLAAIVIRSCRRQAQARWRCTTCRRPSCSLKQFAIRACRSGLSGELALCRAIRHEGARRPGCSNPRRWTPSSIQQAGRGMVDDQAAGHGVRAGQRTFADMIAAATGSIGCGVAWLRSGAVAFGTVRLLGNRQPTPRATALSRYASLADLLQQVQPLVDAAGDRHQFVVRALLGDAAVVEHDDAVGGADRRQPMRDGDHRRRCRAARSAPAARVCSVSLSMREVASSRNRMRGWPASARATAISCFCPDDSRAPPSPSGVS